MIKVSWRPYTLLFKERAVTSRNSMTEKPTYIVTIESDELPGGQAVGEAALFPGLSAEDSPEYESVLDAACREASRCATLAEVMQSLPPVSSVRFGFESAMMRALARPTANASRLRWLDGEEGIRINGLIWMGDKATMRRRICEKLKAGFHCVKLKIGGIDFSDELDLLSLIRKEFPPEIIELRLDANGGFTPENALDRLERLSRFGIHSIEQPIKPGQWECMARLCRESPIPIALDEELIGFTSDSRKNEMLDTIRPQYIILKPSLCGGFREAEKWIARAVARDIGWWGTSALESNIGLEALGIWTAGLAPDMPQGLGTGALYVNNFPSPLSLECERLFYRTKQDGKD